MVNTWCDVGQVFKLWIELIKIRFWDKISHSFSGLDRGRERGREGEDPCLLSTILGVLSVGIHRAKN